MAIRPHPWWLRLVDHYSRISIAKFLPFILSNGVQKRYLPRRPTYPSRNLGPEIITFLFIRVVLWLKPRVNENGSYKVPGGI